MQYNDGNKARLREGEWESLRVLSSVGDNYSVGEQRDTERRSICIYLAEQKKASLRLRKGGSQDMGKEKYKKMYVKFQVFHTNLLVQDIPALHNNRLISMRGWRAYQVIFQEFKKRQPIIYFWPFDLSSYASGEESSKILTAN